MECTNFTLRIQTGRKKIFLSRRNACSSYLNYDVSDAVPGAVEPSNSPFFFSRFIENRCVPICKSHPCWKPLMLLLIYPCRYPSINGLRNLSLVSTLVKKEEKTFSFFSQSNKSRETAQFAMPTNYYVIITRRIVASLRKFIGARAMSRNFWPPLISVMPMCVFILFSRLSFFFSFRTLPGFAYSRFPHRRCDPVK